MRSGRGMGGCEQRIEVFVKMQKKVKMVGVGVGPGGRWFGVVGDGGCKPRIKVLLNGGCRYSQGDQSVCVIEGVPVRGGVRMIVNQELKSL